jgi:hypothetical protein
MATRKSSSKPTIAAVPTAAERAARVAAFHAAQAKLRAKAQAEEASPDVTAIRDTIEDASPDVTAIRDTIEDAINALFRIHRLADLTEGELPAENVDGRIFAGHISELCARHGRRLDALYERVSGGVRVGTFDHECYSEAANG